MLNSLEMLSKGLVFVVFLEMEQSLLSTQLSRVFQTTLILS